MKQPLTIVLGYRNREISRVKRCLDSLREQTYKDFSVIFVDYGSDPEFSTALKSLINAYSCVQYIYSETRGLPWNRSHALNTGIRLSESKYIMTSDIDLIFSETLIETILSHVSPHKAIHYLCYYLPKNFNKWDNIKKYISSYRAGCKDDLGLQVLPKKIYDEIQGFDEFYRFWGREDRDLHYRLLDLGVKIEWLDLDECPVYHQWHPIQNHLTPNFMPPGFWEAAQFYFQDNRGILKRNDENWGAIIQKTERQALRIFEEHSFAKKVKIIDGTPVECIAYIVDKFNSIASGQEIIFQFNDGKIPRKFILNSADFINEVLRFFKIGCQLQLNTQIKKNFILSFLEHKSEQILDYFLQFNGEKYVCVIIKK